MFILMNELAVQMKNPNFMILMIMYFYRIFVLIYIIKLIRHFHIYFRIKCLWFCFATVMGVILQPDHY